ncbi:3-dehydroquinate synthase [Pirellulimonas nuda]|uniref:3-dehydroquinate synthase n=1 Tax=Pirellulimonas nuda TaxID=2528009 RepID=A0A518D6P1_9BACT|nr:3-dehydroquinate synthase [Pirellulimonas nuda]QDU87148.1 3-dehydroquinate synthase [Pirellulimonas nuda]
MSDTTDLIRVDLGERSYDIEIGSGNSASLAGFIEARRPTEHVVVVTDSNVAGLHADALSDRLTDQGLEVLLLEIDAGEPSKCADMAFELWSRMLEEGVDRKSVVLAIGGGVVGDLAGFVAATFMRGLPFFQAPTTLLAQVDSSVGGKVGINLPGGKNMVGAFWQPAGVLVDVDLLATLPEREYRAGMAEVVKYGVILDAEFFAYLEANVEGINARLPEVLRHVVKRCCRLKADVVEADETETSGRRAVLNYGHTFGHALEAATGYTRLLHGEAVAIGMTCAARLSEAIGAAPCGFTQRQSALLETIGLPTTTPVDLDPEELLELMWRDKKVEGGQLRLVLARTFGDVGLFADTPSEAILTAIGPSTRAAQGL